MRSLAHDDLRRAAIERVHEARAIPWRWPGDPDAGAIERDGAGTCASKHAWLAQRLEALGLPAMPIFVVGPLVPAFLAGDPAFRTPRPLLEVHEALGILTPWAGPLRVDVTWDPPLLARGLAGTHPWSGDVDMVCAIEPHFVWPAPREGLREAKLALRRRLAVPGEAEERARILTALSETFERWRAGEPLPAIPCTIRSLRPDDSIAALTSLLRDAYRTLAEMGLRFVAADQDEATTRARIAGGTCFVAEGADGALLGTLTLLPPQATGGAPFLDRQDVASLTQLAVAPAARGRGLARQLVAHAERAAAQAGFGVLAIDTALVAPHLLRFYTSLGYRQVETTRWPTANYESAVLAKTLGGG